jgi:PRC-barrel domain
LIRLGIVTDWSSWRDRTLVDFDGRTIGTIEAVWPDAKTERFTWGIVRTALGHRPAYLPYAEVVESTDEIKSPYSAKTIRAAPAVYLDSPLEQRVAVKIVEHFAAARPPGPGTLPPPPPPKRPPGSANASAGETEGVLA